MTNIQSNNRRTNLNLRELSQVLVAINGLNFPVTPRAPTPSTIQTIPPMGMNDESIVHAYAEAQRANGHCLL